jgi:ubiquinone/menaquinone biosynthesis C-methylase UbiE
MGFDNSLLSRVSDPAIQSDLPHYARMLAAYHQAYCVELREMLAALPIAAGDRVLDIACGDGAYSSWLAEKVGAQGSVTAVDISSAWLQVAQETIERPASRDRVTLCEASIDELPFADDMFDVVWCAQSLYSLPDTRRALEEMVRVVRPGGIVALLENDTLHHILLPWPVEMELEIRTAEMRAFEAETDRPRKYYVGRRLTHVLQRAGLAHVAMRPWSSIHQFPLAEVERTFLADYLMSLWRRTAPLLDSETRRQLENLVHPASQDYLLDQPDLAIICLDLLVWGVKQGCTLPEGDSQCLST